jgi:hypothetical protein
MQGSLDVPPSSVPLPDVLILRSPAKQGVSKDGIRPGQPLRNSPPWCLLRDTDRERSVPHHRGHGGGTAKGAGASHDIDKETA